MYIGLLNLITIFFSFYQWTIENGSLPRKISFIYFFFHKLYFKRVNWIHAISIRNFFLKKINATTVHNIMCMLLKFSKIWTVSPVEGGGERRSWPPGSPRLFPHCLQCCCLPYRWRPACHSQRRCSRGKVGDGEPAPPHLLLNHAANDATPGIELGSIARGSPFALSSISLSTTRHSPESEKKQRRWQELEPLEVLTEIVTKSHISNFTKFQ